MKSLKSVFLTLVLASAAFVIGAAEAVKVAPGAALYVYNNNSSVQPDHDAEPITVVVDKSKAFSKSNLKNIPDTRKLGDQNVFLVWKGYIQIEEKGMYTFSLSFHTRGHGYANNVIFLLDGKPLLSISHIRTAYKQNDSRSVMLEKGDHEVTIINKCIFVYGDFSMQMWNKNRPLKKTPITPDGMFHAE